MLGLLTIKTIFLKFRDQELLNIKYQSYATPFQRQPMNEAYTNSSLEQQL